MKIYDHSSYTQIIIKRFYFFFFAIIKKKPSQSTKETKAKSAKLRRIVVKEFNDEFKNLMII